MSLAYLGVLMTWRVGLGFIAISIRALSQWGTVKNESVLSQTGLSSNPRGIAGMVWSTLLSSGFSLHLRRNAFLRGLLRGLSEVMAGTQSGCLIELCESLGGLWENR